MAMAEGVGAAFDHGSRERAAELNDEKTQLLVTAMARQVEEWKASLPPKTSETGQSGHVPLCL